MTGVNVIIIVYGFGSNCFGQCGVDRKQSKLSSLTQVEGLEKSITQVSFKADATLLYLKYCWFTLRFVVVSIIRCFLMKTTMWQVVVGQLMDKQVTIEC